MTSKLVPQPPSTGTEEKFPDFPPRDDMQNSLHLHAQSHQNRINDHFGPSNSIIVLGETPLRWTPSQQRGHRIPDLMVAFNVDHNLAVRQDGYSISEQGKPPHFVLEIASKNTGVEDYTGKRHDYADFGVPEYWRFDASGQGYHDALIAGDRLVNGVYDEIEIVHTDASHHWGHSQVLNLDLCWENGELRWWDPVTQDYLPTFAEVRDKGAAAEARADTAEARADTEQQARLEAEARAESERQERIQAQAQAERDTAQARIQQLEDELRRQRDQ